jgi:hypothetical protein
MANQLDNKETSTFEVFLISNIYSQEAIVMLLSTGAF